MSTTPKAIRDLVQKDYVKRQRNIEDLKEARQAIKNDLAECEKDLMEVERDLEAMADWLRNNQCAS